MIYYHDPVTQPPAASLIQFTPELADGGPRSAALVRLLLANGLRISEALAGDPDPSGWNRGHRTLQIVRIRCDGSSAEPRASLRSSTGEPLSLLYTTSS